MHKSDERKVIVVSVDCHIHALPEDMLAWFRAHAEWADARFEQREPGKALFLIVGGRWPFELKLIFHEREIFLQTLAQAGIERALLSRILQLFFYDADPSLTREAARAYNEALLTGRMAAPTQLDLLATLPLNDPTAAVEELNWPLAQGMRGAIIGPGVSETLLSDERFTPFWETAN